MVVKAIVGISLILCYVTESSNWTLVDTLLSPVGVYPSSSFGVKLSMNHDATVVAVADSIYQAVGGYGGGVFVFQHNGTDWNQMGSVIAGNASFYRYASGLSLNYNGDRLSTSDENGIVKIFEWDGVDWIQMAPLHALPDWEITTSTSVCTELNAAGDRVVIGQSGYPEISFTIRVFQWDGTAWNQMGDTLEDIGSVKQVRINGAGDIIGTGIYSINDATYKGVGLVMKWNGTDWMEFQRIVPDPETTSWFGYGTAMNYAGDTFAFTSEMQLSPLRTYHCDATTLVCNQTGSVYPPDDWTRIVEFNAAGNIMAVGSCSQYSSPQYAGRIRVYQYNGNEWEQLGADIEGWYQSQCVGSNIEFNDEGSIIAGSSHDGDNVYIFEGDVTSQPTMNPTEPTNNPTVYPTVQPTELPTMVPTSMPTIIPTQMPSIMPSWDPTQSPTGIPTAIPTTIPSTYPTLVPTYTPTGTTDNPTSDPTESPTDPTSNPTMDPTTMPSTNPTVYPTASPSLNPTVDPTTNPSEGPTLEPTEYPTAAPSFSPIESLCAEMSLTSIAVESEMIVQLEEERDELLYQSKLQYGLIAGLIVIIILMVCKDMVMCCRKQNSYVVPNADKIDDDDEDEEHMINEA